MSFHNFKIKDTLTVLLIIFLLVGSAITLSRVGNVLIPFAIPWTNLNTLLCFISFIGVISFSLIALMKIFQRNIYLIAILPVLLLCICANALGPILVVMWFILASVIVGNAFLSVTKGDSKLFPDCFLIGSGIYGTVVGLAAHFQINYAGLYAFALGVPIVLGRGLIHQFYTDQLDVFKTIKLFSFKECSLDIAIISISMVYFVVALMPELGFDSLSMHLFIPVHLQSKHSWSFDAGTYVWAVMPMLGDWIFSIAYLLGGETSARLINVFYILLLAWFVRLLVKWGGGSSWGGKWAILIFLSTPLTFTEGSSLYVESIWASFVVAAVLAVLKICSGVSNSKQNLPLVALLLGFGIATKPITLLVLPSLLLLMVFKNHYWLKISNLKTVCNAFFLFLIFGCIPYLTSYLLTRNPVFPFYNKIFKSQFYPSAENFRSSYGSGLSWDVIYRITFDSGKFLEASIGAPGFQWMLMLIPVFLALVICKNSRGIGLFLIGLISFCLIFYTQGYLRYVFPLTALFLASIGIAMDSEISNSNLAKYFWSSIAALTIILNLLFFNSGNGFYMDFPIKTVFDSTIKDQYIYYRLPIRSAVKAVNALNVQNKPVAVFAEPLVAGLFGDALFPNWYNTSFQSEVSLINTEQDVAKVLGKRGVEFIVLDANWNGVNCCGDGERKQVLIDRATESIATFGSFSIRKVKPNILANVELLKNPDFSTVKGWNLTSGVSFNKIEKAIVVSVDSPASQSVAVNQGVNYLNTVTARCHNEETDGRLQINWHDVSGAYISSSIKVFKCSKNWQDYTMNAVPPPKAVTAVIYATGHSSIPLEFKSDSLVQ